MIIDKLRFGIETTIVGFFSFIPIVFIYMGIHKQTPATFIYVLSGEIPKEFMPFLVLIILALSYAVGGILDVSTHLVFKKILKNSKLRLAPQKEHDKIVADFFQFASDSLQSEYDFKRGKNLIARVFSLILFVAIFSVCYWQARMGRPILWTRLLTAGVLSFLTYVTTATFYYSYVEYVNFRDAAFASIAEIREESKKPKSKDSAQPGVSEE